MRKTRSLFIVLILSAVMSQCDNEANFKRTQGGKRDPLTEDNQLPARIEKVFKVNEVKKDTLTSNLEHQFIDQEIILDLNYQEVTQEMTQNARMDVLDAFQQGRVGKAHTDTFEQGKDHGVLDILIVVDNSGSMDIEQVNLGNKLAPLLNYVSNSDWQIGIVTTDPSNGCMRALIRKGDVDVDAKFQNGIKAGIAGSSVEQGIFMAVEGLKCNTNWLRPNSNVAVLIVSDEENSCLNATNPSCKSSYLVDYLKTIRPSKYAKVYGLIWIPNTVCSSGRSQGATYQEAIDATNGISGSICSSDYSSTLRKISENISTTLQSQFQLAYPPDLPSLKVYVDNNLQAPTTFTLSGRVLTFINPPSQGAKIRIEYLYDSRPVLTSFRLSTVAAPSTIKVSVDGSDVIASGFAYDNNSQTIVFKAPPADNADIRVSFKKDEPLLKVFVLNDTKNIKISTLKVQINNVMTSDFKFNASSSSLEFNEAPIDASSIRATFSRVLNPNLVHRIGGNDLDIVKIEVLDKNNKESVKFQHTSPNITVDASEFVENRMLIARLWQADRKSRTWHLPNEPMAGSLSVQGDITDCAISSIQIIESSMQTNCDFSHDKTVTINYQYIEKSSGQFVIRELSKFAMDKYNLNVTINDKDTMNYIVKGEAITVKDPLPNNSTVKIVLKIKD